MQKKEPWTFSEICFRICGTCVVLAVTIGVGGCAANSSDAKSFAGVLFAGAGLSLVVGLIALIWDQ